MGKLNEQQKLKIKSKLEYNERVKKLRFEQEALVKNLSNKVKARLNLVPKKYWNLKLKDIIELEKNEKMTFVTLLNELQRQDPTRNSDYNMMYMKHIKSRGPSVSPKRAPKITSKFRASSLITRSKNDRS